MSEKHESENKGSEQTWHSRHQHAEDLPSYSAERWQERAADEALCFVARASGRIHGPEGDGEGDGEWRLWAWPKEFLNGPEALLGISLDWVDDIAESNKIESLGGIALDLASCERLAEAVTHAAAVLRAGRWVERPAGDAEAAHQETLRQLAEVTAERDGLAKKLREALTYDHFADL